MKFISYILYVFGYSFGSEYNKIHNDFCLQSDVLDSKIRFRNFISTSILAIIFLIAIQYCL